MSTGRCSSKLGHGFMAKKEYQLEHEAMAEKEPEKLSWDSSSKTVLQYQCRVLGVLAISMHR